MVKPSQMTAAEFGSFVAEVMEDPNLPHGLREYLIALVHELRMQRLHGRSRTRSRTGQDLGGRSSDVWRDAAWLLHPDYTDKQAWQAAKSIVGSDAPRYEMPWDNDGKCIGTMLRPEGAPCKRRAYMRSSLPNPMTGELRMIGACRDPRHVAMYQAQHRDGWAAWKLNGSPKPANNTGGHLRRYLHYTQWDQLYSWASHRYQPGGTPEPEKPRARLALVTPIRSATPEES